MNLETKITIYKFTPQVFTLTLVLILFTTEDTEDTEVIIIYELEA